MLYNIKAGTYTIAKVNEDHYGYTETSAWVLDGSTGLGKKDTVSGPGSTDARWYTVRFSDYLREHIEDDLPLNQVFSNGVIHTWGLYSAALGDTPYEPIDIPCTVGTAVRIRNGMLEYISVGDCRLIIRHLNGDITEIYDRKLCELDDGTISIGVEEAKKRRLPFSQCREYYSDRLKAVRLLTNTPEGYIALSNDPISVLNAPCGAISLDDIRDVCLVSDGYAEYYEMFGIVPDAGTFIEKVSTGDTQELFDELLKTQNDDADFSKHPRFKLSDDSTIIYFTVNA